MPLINFINIISAIVIINIIKSIAIFHLHSQN